MRPYRPTTRDPRTVEPQVGDVLVASAPFGYAGYRIQDGDAFQVVRVDGSRARVQGADGDTYDVDLPSLPTSVTVHSSTILHTVQNDEQVPLSVVWDVLREFGDRYADFHPSVLRVRDDIYEAVKDRV